MENRWSYRLIVHALTGMVDALIAGFTLMFVSAVMTLVMSPQIILSWMFFIFWGPCIGVLIFYTVAVTKQRGAQSSFPYQMVFGAVEGGVYILAALLY